LNTNNTLIIDESACSLQVIRNVNRLLPHERKKNFTCGYRVLSENLDASLLCLSKFALRGGNLKVDPMSRRTTSPSVSRINKQKSRQGHEGYKSHQYQGSKRARNAAIIVFIVAIFGILISLLAFLIFTTSNNNKKINKLAVRATIFLDENKQKFLVDSQERKKKVAEAKSIIEKINDFIQKKQNEDLQNRRIDLAGWIAEAEENGQKYDDVAKLYDRLQDITSKNSNFYPRSTVVQDIYSIKKKLVLFLTSEDKLNDEASQKVNDSWKIFKAWENGLEKHLTPIETKISKIQEQIFLNDPDSIQYPNLKQGNYADLNDVNYSDLKQDGYTNPIHILKQVKSRIDKFDKLKKEIVRTKNDQSLRNASQSTIHKKTAEGYSKDLNECEKTINHYVTRLNKLKKFADSLKKTENLLTSKKKEIVNFEDALNDYGEFKNTHLHPTGVEQSLMIHCEIAIVDYYKNNIKDNIPIECVTKQNMYNREDISTLYECIKESFSFSLKNEMFRTLREAKINCQKQNKKEEKIRNKVKEIKDKK